MRPVRAAVLSIFVLIVPVLAWSQEAATPAADLTAKVDTLFAEYNSKESPGCSVAVRQDGKTVVSRAYGMADLEHDVPNTPATVFEAGSVSKQFTAAAVVLLAQQGKLSLDDEVRKYIPELPDYGTPITIRHLIHHISGLRDWGTVVEAAGWPRGQRVHTHDHVLDVVRRQKSLNFPPGSEHLYSNTGYNLLAILVERVSGQSFAEFTKRHLFEPLGMTQTQWRDDHTRVVKGRAIAYRKAPDGFHSLMPFENVHGNGGLLTTVGDLLIWNDHLANPKVGGRALIEELERRGRLTDGREIEYAGGLYVTRYHDLPEINHGGATAGYRALLTRFPEQKLSIALLCNAANMDGELAHQVADLFLPAWKEPEVAAVPLKTEELAARAGLYRNLRTNGVLRLVFQEGKLRVADGPELIPQSGSLFKVGSQRIEFDGKGLRGMTADGDVIPFERIAEAAPTPAQLAGYVGEYRSDEAEVTYTIAIEDGGLVLRLRPSTVLKLTPTYADAFTFPGGTVRFLRDGQGKVTELSAFLGRVRDLRFQRVR